MLSLLKGMGKAYLRNRASKQTFKAAGKTKKLQFPVIKSVPVAKDVLTKGGVERSIKKVKTDAYIKNIDEVNKHKKAIAKAEEAEKKLEHMVDTKKAYKIGKKSVHPRDPGKKKQIGED